MRRGKKGIRIAGGIGLFLLLGALLLGGSLWASMQSRSDLLPVGSAAPDFTAATSDGKTVRLSELRGRKRVVLVFYPGDYTPVCTSQLCSFRDNWQALAADNAVVYGINPASAETHHGFAQQNRLPFPLLADSRGEIAGSYGCRALFGIIKRTVYVLDAQGRVAWVKRGNPAPSEILEALRNLKKE